MMKKIIYILLIFIVSNITAQQVPIFRQYNVNRYLYNPAMAGSDNNAKAMLHYRKQWAGVDGSPETAVFAIDGKAKNKPVGLGFVLTNDVTNIIGRTSGYGTYSYKFKINDNHKLDAGISVGFVQNKIFFDRIRVDNIQENTLLQNQETSTGFDANIGLRYVYKKLEVGIVSAQLLNNKLKYLNNTDFKEVDFQLIRHFLLDVKYNYNINDNFKIMPSLVLRGAQGMPVQYDFNITTEYKNKYWLNLAYSPQFGVSIGLGGIVYDNFIVSYNYDVTTGEMYGLSGNSHEISVGYIFSSNIHTSKEFEIVKTDYNEYEKINQEQSEKIDEVEQTNENLTQEISEKDKIIEQQAKEIERLKKAYAQNIGKITDNLSASQKKNIDEINSIKTNAELETGYYVIVGSFVNFKNAKSYQKILKNKFNIETEMFQNNKSKYYFVYSKQSRNLKELKKEYKKLLKMGVQDVINSNIWFYKVETKNEISN